MQGMRKTRCTQILLSVIFLSTLISCSGGDGGGLPQTDQTAPVILSVSPTDGQLDVPDTTNISMVFNEDVSVYDRNSIVIKQYQNTNTPPVTLADPLISGEKAIEFIANTKTLTFKLSASVLQQQTKYQVLIRNIKDANNNTIADKIWEFGTTTNPSAIIQPLANSTSVALSSDIMIKFSEPMDLTTIMVNNVQNETEQNPINFTLTESNAILTNIIVPNTNITVSYNTQTNTARYTVKTTTERINPLLKATTYTATLSTAVQDKNSLSLLNPAETNFITGNSVDSGVKPQQPNTISASVNNGSATIIWSKITGTDITYNLYLSTDGGVTYNTVGTTIGTAVDANSFGYNYPMTSDIPHRFAITAVEADVESVFAIANDVTLVSVPEPPTGLTVVVTATTTGEAIATVTWDTLPNLNYRLSVSTDQGNTYSQLLESATSIFTSAALDSTNTYRYKLQAIDAQDNPSPEIVTQDVVLLTVSAVVGDAQVTLNWTNPVTNLTGLRYNVHLSKDNKKTYQKITDKPLTGLSYFYHIANNIPYYFAVTAVNSAGQESIKVVANDALDPTSKNGVSFTPRAGATRISSSANNSCAIRNDGSLWCWGKNYAGQLGIGFSSISESPVQVVGIPATATQPIQYWTDWVAVSVGEIHSCAIRKEGGIGSGLLYCWGSNNSGELGIGIAGTTVLTPTPVIVPTTRQGTVNWTKVSVGLFSTCAIHSSNNLIGELFCWGNNSQGQLGNGQSGTSAPNILQPESVAGGVSPYTDWLDVHFGSNHVCGIRQQTPSNTTLWCWGGNSFGQVGDNISASRSTGVSVPTQEHSLRTSWASVAVGANHSCAVDASDNTLWCWGLNIYGQLGSGNFSTASVILKEEVTLARDWVKVFSGGYSTCGLKSNGQISCWGQNWFGGTGNQLARVGNNTPQIFIANKNWLEIAVGYYHSCGLDLSKNVSCWGSADSNKLGIISAYTGDPVSASTGDPVQVRHSNLQPLTDIIDFSLPKGIINVEHVYSLQQKTGMPVTAYAWGNNLNNQIGAGTYLLSAYKTSLKFEIKLGASPNIQVWKKISTGVNYTCAIAATDSSLWCWGDDSINTAPTKPKIFDAGPWSNVAITGATQGCGIKSVDKSLWCWGSNAFGQLGVDDVALTFSTTPLEVAKPLTAVVEWDSISVTNTNTCAITTTSELYCWGSYKNNILGDGTNSTINKFKPNPVTVPTSTTMWKKIKHGQSAACGLTTANLLYCWGNNNFGQVSPTGSKLIPTLVTAGSGTWSDFDVGGSHNCAINFADDTMWCWGFNARGQLGRGKVSYGIFSTPKVISLATAKWGKIVTGEKFSCATRTDEIQKPNSLWCWGGNEYGELGDNQAWKFKPGQVGFP